MDGFLMDESMFRQVIMDHYNYPQNKVEEEVDGYLRLEGINPSCGDQLTIFLKIENIQIANASSVYAIPIAHYVFSQILRWNKRIDQHIEFQQSKHWVPIAGDGELTDKTLVVLGYGGIGKQVAKLGKAFGMRVTGIKRNPADDEYADEVLGLDQFEELLPLTDYLVLALPDSARTRDVINADVLKKLNNSAMLINVGRGTAINEEDLTNALNDGKIAAAALDTQPL